MPTPIPSPAPVGPPLIPADLAIRGLNLPNSPAITVPVTLAGAGGALFSSDDLSVDSSSFLTNAATVSPTGGGGAIDNDVGGRLQVTDGTFQDNEAFYDGGALYNDAGAEAVVDQSSFSGNEVLVDAGGAVANVGVLTVTNSVFTANVGAPAFGSFQLGGGAIMSTAPLALANTSAASRQRHSRRGSQVRLPGTLAPFSLYIDHTRFISNSSEYEGGAIDASPAVVVHSTFISNTASYGGAIDIVDLGFAISASTFIANAAITTTTDFAQEGGAIDTFSSGLNHISVINSTFYANQAVGAASGGAIDGESGVIGITNSTFLSNSVVVPGQGGAFAGNSNFFLYNTLVASNAGGNCAVTLTLSGANLEFPGATCGGASVLSAPKALAPADNGGPTLTSALLPSSPAINAGDDAGCPSTDQRGAHAPGRQPLRHWRVRVRRAVRAHLAACNSMKASP